MNLAAIDLNLLVVLHAVLEEGSAAAAAKRLHVTPPAISNALARLRALLDDPLFVRSGRGLVPTPRALELAPVLARTFGEIEGALDGGRSFDPKTTTRELTIALADADQVATLPKIATAFVRAMPRAQLRVVSVDTLVSRGGLAEGAADVVIGPSVEGPGIHTRPLFVEEAVMVVRKGHPRVKRTLTRELFGSLRHVDVHLALGRGGVGNKAAVDAFARMGLVRDIAITVPTFAAAAMVVASTDLVSGMPRRMAERFAKMVPLAIVGAPFPAMRFEMLLSWHDRTDRDPAVAAFRELIAATFH